MSRASLLAASALLVACGSAPEPTAPSPAPSPAPAAAPAAGPDADASVAESAALERAQASMGKTGAALKENLLKAMSEGGPKNAVEFCSTEAMAITDAASGDAVQVGRASLKTRNPANTGPDWVKAWLVDAQAKVDGGADPASLTGVKTIAATADGSVARVLKPILVEGPCLNCHGGSEQVSPEVTAILAERYPEDTATGYALGQLRGAFWAQTPVTPGG